MFKKLLVKAIDITLTILGDPEPYPIFNNSGCYQPHTSRQIIVPIINPQKIPEDPEDLAWPPKNRMHKRIS
jgi:hypothetical protein